MYFFLSEPVVAPLHCPPQFTLDSSGLDIQLEYLLHSMEKGNERLVNKIVANVAAQIMACHVKNTSCGIDHSYGLLRQRDNSYEYSIAAS
jgi:hypothetical protein